jgi:hypothetical protein
VGAGPRSEAEFFSRPPQIVVEKEGNRAVSIMWTPFNPLHKPPTHFRNLPRERAALAL